MDELEQLYQTAQKHALESTRRIRDLDAELSEARRRIGELADELAEADRRMYSMKRVHYGDVTANQQVQAATT